MCTMAGANPPIIMTNLFDMVTFNLCHWRPFGCVMHFCSFVRRLFLKLYEWNETAEGFVFVFYLFDCTKQMTPKCIHSAWQLWPNYAFKGLIVRFIKFKIKYILLLHMKVFFSFLFFGLFVRCSLHQWIERETSCLTLPLKLPLANFGM